MERRNSSTAKVSCWIHYNYVGKWYLLTIYSEVISDCKSHALSFFKTIHSLLFAPFAPFDPFPFHRFPLFPLPIPLPREFIQKFMFGGSNRCFLYILFYSIYLPRCILLDFLLLLPRFPFCFYRFSSNKQIYIHTYMYILCMYRLYLYKYQLLLNSYINFSFCTDFVI